MIAKTLVAFLAIVPLVFANPEYNVAKYCQLVQPETKLASTTSCQTFYTCQGNAEPIVGQCTGDTVFSKDVQGCVPASNGDCYIGQENACKDRDQQFAKKGCNSYYWCLNSKVAGSGTCPWGEIFNPTSSSCVYGTCSNDIDNGIGDIANLCEVMPSGVYFGDFKDCSAWHKCNGYAVKSGKCLDSMVFDTASNMCLVNDGNMCQRTGGAISNDASGPPKGDCTTKDLQVGDTNICSIYYVCQKVSNPSAPPTTNPTYEWVQEICGFNKFFDVISQSCANTQIASPYPGCNRCQFSTGNPYWVNAVDATCSEFLTCKNGQKVANGICKGQSFFNEASQSCIVGTTTLPAYVQNHGACADYSCDKTTRACKLNSESGSGDGSGGSGSGGSGSGGSETGGSGSGGSGTGGSGSGGSGTGGSGSGGSGTEGSESGSGKEKPKQ